MQENTKKALSQYVEMVGRQNNIHNPTEKFTVAPAAEQRIVASIRESNWFLKAINVMTVKNQNGEALGLGVKGMIASRTATNLGKLRKTRSMQNLSAMKYKCEQTNFDTHITYAQLDAFAHLPNFAKLISKENREQADENKASIGFYGVEAAADTKPDVNVNGEDVNIGWIQAIRDNRPAQIITSGAVENEIKLGEGGDYINLDLLVLDVRNLLSPACVNASDLVAIVGTDLLAYEKAKFYSQHGNTPSEKARIEEAAVIGSFGGLPAYSVPGFPPTGVMVTSFKNLSIYIQEGSIRKSVGKKNDERDCVESFESMNMAYVLEHLDKAAAIEFANVKLLVNGEWV